MLLHVIHDYLNILVKHLKFLLSNILSEGLHVASVCLLCLIVTTVTTIFCECLLIDEVYMQHGGEWLAQSHHSEKVLWIPSPGLIYGVYMLASTYSLKTCTLVLILAEMGLTNFYSTLTELKEAKLNCS